MRYNRRALLRSAAWILAVTLTAIANWLTPWTEYVWFFTNIGIPVSFFSSLLFLVYFSTLSRWWHEPMGRFIWWLDFALASIELDSVLISQFGVRLSVIENYRIQLGGVLIAAIVVPSRTILMIMVTGWRPHWPWNIPRPDTQEGKSSGTQ